MNYRKVNARKHAQQQASTTGYSSTTVRLPDDISFLTMEEGSYQLDFLPVKITDRNPDPDLDPGCLFFAWTYYVHKNVGIDEEWYVCPRESLPRDKRDRCPICEEFHRRRKQGLEWSEIKPYRPQHRQLFLVRDMQNQDAGLQIIDMAYFNFGKRLDETLDADEDDANSFFYSLDEDGRHARVSITMSTEGGFKPYPKLSVIQFKKRKPITDLVLEDLPDLGKMLIIPTYSELRHAFLQEESSTEGPVDDPEADEFAPWEEVKPTKTAAVVEDDDDGETEEWGSEDDWS